MVELGKVNVIKLNPDMTFEEKTKKTQSTQVEIDKHYTPSFSMGRSVFREVGISRLKFWKKPRNLLILVDGSDRAFELHDSKTGEIEIGHWTRQEKEKFVGKVVAKSKAQQKIISTWQFVVIMLGIVFIVILQIMTMKGIRIV